MPTTVSPEVPSPCVKLCTLDAAAQTCLGCGRTLAEIAAWGRMDDQMRRAVLSRLASRNAATAKGQALP